MLAVSPVNVQNPPMDAAWIIIDGNNLIHCEPRWSGLQGTSFPTARAQLVHRIASLAGNACDRLIIIFDGTIPGRDQALSTPKVDVQYMAANDSADRRIEGLIREAPSAAEVIVVTNDRTLRNVVFGLGAQTLSCGEFVLEMKAPQSSPPSRYVAGGKKGNFKLGDAFDQAGL